MARENIPSISVHYNDGGLMVPIIEGNLTDSVLVIGNALDGPQGVITRINPSKAESVFGPVTYNDLYTATGALSANYKNKYSGNSLVKGMNEVLMGGATNVYFLRVGGNTASVTSGNLTFKGLYPGKIYNGVSVIVSSATSTLTIVQSGIGRGGNLSFSWASGKTIASLVNDINKEPLNFSVRAEAANTTALTSVIASGSNYTMTLVNGSNGTLEDGSITKAAYYTSLTDTTTGAFALLEDSDADIVYLTDLYADDDLSSGGDGTVSVVTKFAEACYKAAKNSYPKIGVIGMTPALNTTRDQIANIVTNLTASSAGAADSGRKTSKFGYFLASPNNGDTQFAVIDAETGAKVDAGRFIQVVAGPDALMTQNSLGTYIESPAGIYAGFIASLEPQNPATNKMFPGIQALAWEFTTKQVNLLAGAQPATQGDPPSWGYGGAYTALRVNNAGNIVVNMDNTAAKRSSDYAKLQILRIVNSVVEGIRRICNPYIGTANTFGIRIAMRTAIKNYLDRVAAEGAIVGQEGVGYQFAVTSDGVDQILGRIRIDLTLRPAIQITKIDVTINLSPPTGD